MKFIKSLMESKRLLRSLHRCISAKLLQNSYSNVSYHCTDEKLSTLFLTHLPHKVRTLSLFQLFMVLHIFPIKQKHLGHIKSFSFGFCVSHQQNLLLTLKDAIKFAPTSLIKIIYCEIH